MKVYKIETDRLLIRCFQPSDAKMLFEAINKSLENLKLWMPWAKDEPTSIKAKEKLLEQFKTDFEAGKDYTFGIFNKKEDELIGGTGLHTRVGNNAREIGYWINSNFLHNGYATESTQALTKVGFEYDNIDRIEIHCDPLNLLSQKIPEKLGYKLKDVLKNNTVNTLNNCRDTMIWSISKDSYINSPIASVNLTVFDNSGKEISNHKKTTYNTVYKK